MQVCEKSPAEACDNKTFEQWQRYGGAQADGNFCLPTTDAVPSGPEVSHKMTVKMLHTKDGQRGVMNFTVSIIQMLDVTYEKIVCLSGKKTTALGHDNRKIKRNKSDEM